MTQNTAYHQPQTKNKSIMFSIPSLYWSNSTTQSQILVHDSDKILSVKTNIRGNRKNSPNSNLPLTDIFPVCSDKVPSQCLPCHILGYVVYSGSNIH